MLKRFGAAVSLVVGLMQHQWTQSLALLRTPSTLGRPVLSDTRMFVPEDDEPAYAQDIYQEL